MHLPRFNDFFLFLPPFLSSSRTLLSARELLKTERKELSQTSSARHSDEIEEMRIALARKSNFYEINDKSLQSSYIYTSLF